MLRSTELTKRYGPTLALDRLSLDVPAGAVFGLLGPNGSGKSTFLKLVMGFIFPDSGRIDRGGLRAGQIGYLSEHAFYPPRFTAQDYVRTLARLSGLRGRELTHEVDRLLEQLGMAHAAGKRLGVLSRGMLQRIGLVQALLGDPPLVLLDEPSSGLDPHAQKFMRDQILALQAAGKTVFLASHHLDDVTRVCTHVAVLKQGRLVRTGALAELLGYGARVTIVTGPLPDGLAAQLAAVSPGVVVGEGQVTLDSQARVHKAEILRLLLDADVDIRHLDEQHATLEEIYLQATGDAT
jgi:ABC-2 type transport system ATP-binding protein